MEVRFAFAHRGSEVNRKAYLKAPRGALAVGEHGLTFVSLGKHIHRLRSAGSNVGEDMVIHVLGMFGHGVADRLGKSPGAQRRRLQRAQQAVVHPATFSIPWTDVTSIEYADAIKGTPDAGFATTTFDPLRVTTTSETTVFFVARGYGDKAPPLTPAWLEEQRANPGGPLTLEPELFAEYDKWI